MRAIVTGGAGFIGSVLVDYLVARGDQVVVVDNLSTGKIENLNRGAEFYRCDISNYKRAKSAFRSGADAIFHLAALPRVPFSFKEPFLTNRVNLGGTLNVIALAAKYKIKRLVFSSSSSIYGDQTVFPLKEDMKIDVLSPYALQKYAAEKYCRFLSGVDGCPATVSLRYFNVYGPRQSDGDAYSTAIGIFFKNAREGRVSPIYGDGEQSRAFVHVADVAIANVLAAESKNIIGGEVINIGSPKSYTINQVARMIGGEYIYKSPRQGDVRRTEADITKAKGLLGWKPAIDLPDGIAELRKLNGLA